MSDDPRLGGIVRLYGAQQTNNLANSHVAVVGIGGVGSWTAEALARSGIGTITLIDYHRRSKGRRHCIENSLDKSCLQSELY